MKYKNILFDWDGCLVDTLPLWLEGFRESFKDFGYDYDDAFIKKELFCSTKNPINLGIKEEHLSKFWEAIYKRLDAGLKSASLNIGVLEILKYCHEQRINTCIVTSSLKETIWPILEINNASHLIAFIIDAYDVTHLKPDPECVLLAMQKLSADNSHTLIIGDSDKDILAGKAAGISSCLYYPESNCTYYPEDFVATLNSTYIIKSFEDLKNLL